MTARRMAVRNIERVEVVPLVFELGSVCDGETHASEYINNLVNSFRNHMTRAFSHRKAWLRHINERSNVRALRCILLGIERAFDRSLHLIQPLADRRLLVL